MGTYGTDAAGDLRPECECPDDCECLCDGCICRTAGTGWDTDDFWREDPASLRPDAPVDPL